ncbi:ATP-grasp domain-containing protein [Halobacteriovorax sp. JY17]|uniref:D-alanine--D-alanine ligase family protein n=1 Tax=Halobacteriovorax sp. JY17 TaxID=2014617 RepID=UPI000C62ACD1|nr:ATP-grasp domain-containing protein [Halobacteriovorax sp. JY17]PIK14798.1 MAG: D-alanine--D-alanine ligase [Halobacteriovorax sp. JY17]
MKIAFVYNLKRSTSMEEAEFDTQDVIASITEGLKGETHTVVPVEMTKDGKWIDLLKNSNPDIIFNTAEGYIGMGREAYAPTVFEQLNLKYVGSGPYACFLTLDKFLCKSVVMAKGVPAPKGYFISSSQEIDLIADELNYPVFVKPNFEGSSKGITQDSKCKDKTSFLKYAKASLKEFSHGLIVEDYIEGKDITIPYISGLGHDGVLEPIEYVGTAVNGSNIYDYEMKNGDDDLISVLCPAEISEDANLKIKEYMKVVVSSLGINDMARADFRVTPTGDIYFIEVNALPSLQEGAGIFAATSLLGLDYGQTISKILEAATNRSNNSGIKKVRPLKKAKPNVALVYNLKRKKAGEDGYEIEAEFDSQDTVNAIKEAIDFNGFDCKMIEANKDLATNLERENINVVFNIAEGINKSSREAQVPALCDLLSIEHTGSDATCLCLTLNKSIASKIVAQSGFYVPRSALINPRSQKYVHDLTYPIIVKPNQEGSSKGIYNNSVVNSDEELKSFINERFSDFSSLLLAEEYITGREVTVGLLENSTVKVIGISEIVFKGNSEFPVYSYELKQIDDPLNNSEFQVISPPELNDKLKKALLKTSKGIFKATGCRDVARIDFRITSDEKIYFIEVNPLPGLSPDFSDLPIIANKNGLNYNKLIDQILKPAIRRWRKSAQQ